MLSKLKTQLEELEKKLDVSNESDKDYKKLIHTHKRLLIEYTDLLQRQKGSLEEIISNYKKLLPYANKFQKLKIKAFIKFLTTKYDTLATNSNKTFKK